MLSETATKSHERYLVGISHFGADAINIWKDECKKRCKDKTNAYNRFLSWEKRDDEVSIFTSYAYADLKVPKEFDCVFDLNNPGDYSKTKMILIQSIWEAWVPMGIVNHFHKHLLVFKFIEEIPSIIQKLPKQNSRLFDSSKNQFELGICKLGDYDSIRKYLESSIDEC